MNVWLQSADAALFRFINQSLSNPLFDWLMPILSGNKLFVPMVLVAAAMLIWRQRTKGALCVAFVLLVVALGDPLIINSIKHAIARPRPFVPMPEAITLAGRTASFSMPSAHAANMAAVAMVAFLFFRRSWRFMVPLAAAVAFSRVYNGVHYVSDVLIGATLGAGYAAVMVFFYERPVLYCHLYLNCFAQKHLHQLGECLLSLLKPLQSEKVYFEMVLLA